MTNTNTPPEPVKPPMFGEAPARLCTRWLGDRNCGALPVMHVLWDADTMDNGVVCDEHVKELGSRWAFVQAHDLGPDCGMPGANWHFEENTCRCEGSLEAEAVLVRAGGVTGRKEEGRKQEPSAGGVGRSAGETP